MMLTNRVKTYIKKSVLCWLATVDAQGQPNVSPKEIFTHHKDIILIANIASPNTIKNIKQNKKVALSFINILIQKGFQVHGDATLLVEEDMGFDEYSKILIPMLGEKFKMQGIIKIQPFYIRPILAPSYQFYPETKEDEQVEAARKQYGF